MAAWSPGLVGASARLDAHQGHAVVGHERIEHAGGVAAAADAGHDHVGQPAELLQALGSRLAADDRLKIAHDPRERMRADDRAEAVVGGFDRAHPVAEGLVDGVAERARAAADRPDLGPQELHAEDVGPLPADVFLAHVDDAFQAEAGAGRGGGHAVLAGAGLGDHAPLAHAARQQGLAERVVDLVGAGMVQVFAFQIDSRPAAVLAQPLGEVQAATAGPRSADSSSSSSAWNFGSATAFSYSAASSSRAWVRVSGT